MERVARLVNSSQALKRRLWASLPFEVRLAEFFLKTAVDTTDAFGEAIYAEFLKRGVEGMPDYKGTPASELNPRKVLRGYGKEFGKKAFKMLVSKLRGNAQLAEEAMLDFMVRFLSSNTMRPNTSLKDAENYVLKGVYGQALNMLRKKKEISDTYFNDAGEESRHEIPVTDERSIEDELEDTLKKIRSRLKGIHPDAELYVRLALIDGHSDREIIGDVANNIPSMLTHPYSKQDKPLNAAFWSATYKPKIMDLIKKNFDYSEVAA